MTLDGMTASPAVSPHGTAYLAHGQGEAVFWVHGVGMQHGIWAPQMVEFARTHRVVAYDMLGHGASPLPPVQNSLGDYARQLCTLMDDLDIAAANVAGHSMGALVALDFALRHPQRTLRVAALNAVFCRSPAQRQAVLARAAALQQAGVQATLDTTLARWFGQPVPSALLPVATKVRRYLQQVHPLGYARAYQLFAQADTAHAGRLQQLTMPVLFLTGELDANSTPQMSHAMGQQVPQAQVEVITGARHMMSATDPQAVNQRLRRWLERKP